MAVGLEQAHAKIIVQGEGRPVVGVGWRALGTSPVC
jgi:hypothetical protein